MLNELSTKPGEDVVVLSCKDVVWSEIVELFTLDKVHIIGNVLHYQFVCTTALMLYPDDLSKIWETNNTEFSSALQFTVKHNSP